MQQQQGSSSSGMSSNRYYDGSILNRELGANNMGDTAARNMRNNGPIHTSSFSIGTQGQGMVTFQNHMLKNINIAEIFV